MTALVWFKRDLRCSDHAALSAALACGQPVCALAVLEPRWLAQAETHPRQVGWWLHAALALKQRLADRGITLALVEGDMPEVLDRLQRERPSTQRWTRLLSHEETGSGWTYDRDLAVAAWCRQHGVAWQELPQNGVVRRLKDRSGWARRWQARMDAERVASPLLLQGHPGAPRHLQSWPTLALPGGAELPPGLAPGMASEAGARQVLRSFLAERGSDYRRALSSPLTAATGCSRLSEHLAFGTVSMRQVHQATEARIAALQATEGPEAAAARHFAHALRGFSSRLRWHCHFMQKLEDEPAIEFDNFSRLHDGLRPATPDPALLQAWARGQTGYPMVDACMRQLRATGWINFRMRAMLVSFAAYHLWLHWRAPGLHLAREFLDFEPGIHWSQMQMQSGTTGINTLRIYSPGKQAREQDPDGHYIRRWLPELAAVPLPFLAEPWTMPLALQQHLGCRIGQHYPAPVVDEAPALKRAKDLLYGLRGSAPAQAEAGQIQQRHGSRKSGLPSTSNLQRSRKAPAGSQIAQAAATAIARQPDLFDTPP